MAKGVRVYTVQHAIQILENARERKGMTIQQWANRCGLNRTAMAR